MALSLCAMWRVKSVYKRYSQGVVRSGLTGGEVAAQILRRTGIYDVEITEGEGMLGDHYDPIHKGLVQHDCAISQSGTEDHAPETHKTPETDLAWPMYHGRVRNRRFWTNGHARAAQGMNDRAVLYIGAFGDHDWHNGPIRPRFVGADHGMGADEDSVLDDNIANQSGAGMHVGG
jgi:hypothetical protein